MILIELTIGLVVLCLGVYVVMIIITKMDERFKLSEKIGKWFK
jgi:hypothetical protein